MKPIDLTRPDKLIFQGIKSLTNSIDFGFYADQKAEAKANAEVTFIGEKKMEKVQSQLFDYNSKEVSVSEEVVGYEFLKEQVKGRTYWLNFHGIHDVEIIQKIGNVIDLDRLTIRQILDTTQRPKVEEYDQYLFFSVNPKNSFGGV
jgi:magnesium transporter